MCVIIDKPEGVEFGESDLLLAIENNGDGFGWMSADGKGKIIHGKSIKFNPNRIITKMNKELRDTRALFHLRYRTSGIVKKEQCHPFKILDHKVHGVDLFGMHNGTFQDYKQYAGKDTNDTEAFFDKFLKELFVKYGPGIMQDPLMVELLEQKIGVSNKVSLLDGNGNVVHLNESKGDTRHGCWVSNTYSFRPNYRTPINNAYQGGGNWNYNQSNDRYTHKTNKDLDRVYDASKKMYVDRKHHALANIRGGRIFPYADQAAKAVEDAWQKVLKDKGSAPTKPSTVPNVPAKSSVVKLLDKPVTLEPTPTTTPTPSKEYKDLIGQDNTYDNDEVTDSLTETIEQIKLYSDLMDEDEIENWVYDNPEAAARLLHELLN